MRGMRNIAYLLLLCVFFLPYAHDAHALAVNHVELEMPEEVLPRTSWWNTLWQYAGIRSKVPVIRPKEGTVLRVSSSAYASSPYQTDSTPCTTAAGTTVRPGVVATNFLPLGTIVSIDGKKYIVEDRMNSRYSGYYLDIWFASTKEALEFGRKKIDITIVRYDEPGASLEPSPAPVVVEEKKTLWDMVSSSVSELGELLFTKTYSDPNAYDIDCSK